MSTRNAKNRSAKSSTAINIISSTSVGHRNKEWKMEVLKIVLL